MSIEFDGDGDGNGDGNGDGHGGKSQNGAVLGRDIMGNGTSSMGNGDGFGSSPHNGRWASLGDLPCATSNTFAGKLIAMRVRVL